MVVKSTLMLLITVLRYYFVLLLHKLGGKYSTRLKVRSVGEFHGFLLVVKEMDFSMSIYIYTRFSDM